MLLVEPYYGGSHASWVDGIKKHSKHKITCVTHPDSYWRWRLRGGAVTLAEETKAAVTTVGKIDLALVPSMVDLSAWLGLTRKTLKDIPTVLYLHENQLNYPVKPGEKINDEFAITNWRSLLAADEIWFNSDFQRQALFQALPSLLHKAPDFSHEYLITEVKKRTRVVPVGVELQDLQGSKRKEEIPLILWNQRWDYDKNPEEIASSILQLADEKIDFNIALVGENVRNNPHELLEVRDQLGERVVEFGFLPRDDYLRLLNKADVVISAAKHEFFGISVVEALAAGAIPVLPNHQSYPEIIPEPWHTSALYTPGELVDRLRDVLLNLDTWSSTTEGLAQEMQKYDWSVMIDTYDSLIESVIKEYGHNL